MQTQNLDKLTLNFLSEEAYKQAKDAGELDETQLYMTPDYSNEEPDTSTSTPDVFSTTETKTNKIWLDGKPIYRTVIITTVADTDIQHGIPNINEITNVELLLKQPSGMYSKQDGSTTFVNKTMYVVYLDAEGTYTIVIEYTKTTD